VAARLSKISARRALWPYNGPVLTIALQSGSNGNCIYVEAAGTRLLFDAGISGAQAKARLATHGRDIYDVDAVILSHRHGDHTASAGVYQRLFKLPLYATPATHHAIARRAGQLAPVHHFQPGQTLVFGSVQVHTLPTPHDAAESVAFVVTFEQKRLGILTDLGHPFPELAAALAELDAAFLETNYDPVMLAEGTYPPELKARIRGDGGHLSNDEAAALLKNCRRHRPAWIALAHLSAHNNHPDVALQTMRRELGHDYPLHLTSRSHATDVFTV
jgi:phosphoribosyl 1,2-cyclic phosphodiesterase